MSTKYSDNLETLIALVTHLAMTDWSMRTPPNLAKALSIDESDIEAVLNTYKGLFRRSAKTSRKSEKHFYALQIRHARQWIEDRFDDDEGEKKPPLDSIYLTTLLNFITHKVLEEGRQTTGLRAAWITAGASALVAIIAITFGNGAN